MIISYTKAFVCLLLIIPLVQSEHLITRTRTRGINLSASRPSLSENNENYDLRDSIPGEPGLDYPIYNSPPETSFTCLHRHEGYYADVETRCQAFRICSNTDQTGRGFSFLCPNGTLFSQRDFVCDWYKNVDCNGSPSFYFMNDLLDKAISPNPDLMMKDVTDMVSYPMKIMAQQQAFQQAFPQQPKFEATPAPSIDIRFQGDSGDLNKPVVSNQFGPSIKNPFENGRQRFFFRGQDRPVVQPAPAQPQIPTTRQPFQQFPVGPPRQEFQPSPATSTTTPEPILENQDNINNYEPGKVYISSLGELSTDPGSTFDPQTSLIIPDQSQEQSPLFSQSNQEHLLAGKLEPSQSDATRNLLLNTESITSSIPGNINSQLALLRDRPIVDGSTIQIPSTLHVSLNYAQKINTGLNNVLIPTTVHDQIAANPILSADGKFTNQVFGQTQNPLQDNGAIFNFAQKINSAFHVNAPLTDDGFGKAIAQSIVDNLGSTVSSIQAANNGSPYGPDGIRLNQPSAIASGYKQAQHQFQFNGLGFTKSSPINSMPASNLHTQTLYFPSINFKQKLSSENLTEATTPGPQVFLDQQPTPTPTPTVQILLNINGLRQDPTAASDVGQSTVGLDDGLDRNHVKRAESLLVQGVHLSLYDENSSDKGINDNSIDSVVSTLAPKPVEVTISMPTESSYKIDDDLNVPLRVSINTDRSLQSITTVRTPQVFPTSTHRTETDIDPLHLAISTTIPFQNDVVLTTTESPTITEGPTIILSSTQGLILSSTQGPTSTAGPTPFPGVTSTQGPTTTQRLTKTEGLIPNSTQGSTSNAGPTPFLEVTSTQGPTSTQKLTTIEGPTSTPIPTTTQGLTTIQGSTEEPITSTTIHSRTRPTRPTRIPRPTKLSIEQGRKPSFSRGSKRNGGPKLHSRNRRPPIVTTTKQTKLEKPASDSTANLVNSYSYGIRAALSKNQNKTNKFTILKRPPKLTFIEDSNHASASTLSLSKTKYIPNSVSSASYNFNNNNHNSNSSMPTRSPLKKYRNTYKIQPKLQAFGQQTTTTNVASSGFKRITSRGRHLKSTRIIQNQPISESKESSTYFTIPGTKISIAKSREEGYYSVSNYPLQSSNEESEELGHTFLHPGSPFVTKSQPDLDSNFFLPFPTISSQIKSTSTPTVKTPFIYEITTVAPPSLTSIPLSSHTAQRRSDAFVIEDGDEHSLFTGVSSYHVPLSSVGRLPADIKGTKRK